MESWARKHPAPQLLMITTTRNDDDDNIGRNDVTEGSIDCNDKYIVYSKRGPPCYINFMFDDRMPRGSWRFSRNHWPTGAKEFILLTKEAGSPSCFLFRWNLLQDKYFIDVFRARLNTIIYKKYDIWGLHEASTFSFSWSEVPTTKDQTCFST